MKTQFEIDMNTQEIIENNKLIAEFMGLKFKEDEQYVKELKEMRSEGIFFEQGHMLSELKYHTSWEWLMPVVERIEEMGFSTQVNTIGRQHQITKFEIFSGGADVLNRISKSKKEATYKAVVGFIQWYNQNKES